MIEMCGAGPAVEASKIFIVMLSLAISASAIIFLKKFNFSSKSKIFLIYSHLVSLLFPLVFLTTNAGCASVCASCYTNIYHLAGLALPSTLVISTVLGFFVIPALFVRSNKQSELSKGWVYDFVKRNSKAMGIKQPKVYTLNKPEPVAFSFRNFKSAVFLSVGLFDILKLKEMQAVILHELAHIKQKSSALKMSTYILRIFSPASILLRFHHNNKEEEKKADLLAIRIQGTDKHIKSARDKILEYYSC